MAAAHRQLVHGLVDRSHERVVQTKAGQRLHHILSDGEHLAAAHSTSLPLLPPHITPGGVAPALVYNARTNERRARQLEAGSSSSKASEPFIKPRRQGVMAAAASVDELLKPQASSQEQFLAYTQQKSYRSGGLRPSDRRQGVLPKAKDLHKLVVAMNAEQEQAHESAKTKLARALAKLRGHGAFLQARELQPPPTPALSEIKNPHLAFLEFRRQGAEIDTSHHRIHPSAGLEDGNTTAKIPIRFGDQVCLLSSASHLPLAIGSDGRSCTAESTAVGPHMTFTIVDFCRPSRQDELTVHDAFWLRIDSSALHDTAGIGHHEEGDDLASLLVDTSHYLGCPGWLDTECTAQAKRRRRGRAGEERPKLFRLVAMKASTPSRAYYGDDEATREFAMETNEHVVRLARWRFVALQQQQQQQQVQSSTGDVNDALLNCSEVQLTQDHHFELSYDASQLRGVCRPGSRRSREREARPPTGADDGVRQPRKSKAVPLDRIWQVRLLRRQASPSRNPTRGFIAEAEAEGDDDDPAVKWLREKQAVVARNGEKVASKMGLAQLAREQFERVAAESNGKLAMIEQHKAQRANAYFGQLLHASTDSVKGSSPSRKAERTRLPNLRQ